MRTRRHAPWLATGAALLLLASVSGLASAAPLVSDTVAPVWVDANGNGVADGCETAVVADQTATAAANLAADLDGDGTISTSEAAQTNWIGGTNCNHGGYVSTVAKTSADTCDEGDAPEATTDGTDQGSDGDATLASTDSAPVATDSCTEDAPTAKTDAAAPTACAAAPAADPTTVAAPLTVVEVAQSDAVGGKNCNHGGAVSEAAKAANAERAAARALKVHGNAKSHKHSPN
jgi:hypothetical protein